MYKTTLCFYILYFIYKTDFHFQILIVSLELSTSAARSNEYHYHTLFHFQNMHSQDIPKCKTLKLPNTGTIHTWPLDIVKIVVPPTTNQFHHRLQHHPSIFSIPYTSPSLLFFFPAPLSSFAGGEEFYLLLYASIEIYIPEQLFPWNWMRRSKKSVNREAAMKRGGEQLPNMGDSAGLREQGERKTENERIKSPAHYWHP